MSAPTPAPEPSLFVYLRELGQPLFVPGLPVRPLVATDDTRVIDANINFEGSLWIMRADNLSFAEYDALYLPPPMPDVVRYV